jgi:hypothetical protein
MVTERSICSRSVVIDGITVLIKLSIYALEKQKVSLP